MERKLGKEGIDLIIFVNLIKMESKKNHLIADQNDNHYTKIMGGGRPT